MRVQVVAAAEAKEHTGSASPWNIAVVDAGGNLVSHVRMDGAWIGSIDISINKAFTARAFDISTAELSENSQPGRQFYGIQNSNDGRIMIFAGGVPLVAQRASRRRHRHQRRQPGSSGRDIGRFGHSRLREEHRMPASAEWIRNAAASCRAGRRRLSSPCDCNGDVTYA